MRVQVNLSDELVAQIDEYAKAVGLSRSGVCAFFVGQGMFSINKSYEMASNLLKAAAGNSGSERHD